MTQEASKKQQDAERCLAKLTRLICVSSQHVGSTQDQARKVCLLIFFGKIDGLKQECAK